MIRSKEGEEEPSRATAPRSEPPRNESLPPRTDLPTVAVNQEKVLLEGQEFGCDQLNTGCTGFLFVPLTIPLSLLVMLDTQAQRCNDFNRVDAWIDWSDIASIRTNNKR